MCALCAPAGIVLLSSVSMEIQNYCKYMQERPNTKQSRWWSASYKGEWDIIHVVLVISNYAAVVHVKLNEKRGGKVAAGEWINWDEKKDVSRGGEAEGKLKSSKLLWSIKDPQCKNNICHFICSGRLKAICHTTYPSYRVHADTSIHLFRHLTCLESRMEEKMMGSWWERRTAGNKAFFWFLCFLATVLIYMTV